MTLPERITEKITIQADGCWAWGGALSGNLGIANVDGRSVAVRRLTYEDARGPIHGKLIQRCQTPSCVNPVHLSDSHDIARFWDLVDKAGPRHPRYGRCWLWMGGRGSKAYGGFTHRGVMRGAHQVAFELDRGTPPKKGLVIMHLCDRRECVRPSHLREGTQAENIQDAARKGRRAVGTRHPSARLTPAAVKVIRKEYAAGMSQQALADRYGITQPAVSSLIRGRSWKHVH